MPAHHFDHFRFSAALRLVKSISPAAVSAALAAAPAASLDYAKAKGATLPAARLALAAMHQADLHLVSDAVAFGEIVG